jgi:hypothetical protein
MGSRGVLCRGSIHAAGAGSLRSNLAFAAPVAAAAGQSAAWLSTHQQEHGAMPSHGLLAMVHAFEPALD